jgi:hypothetical protein
MLTLIDLIQHGNSVAMIGAADKSLIGRIVTITFQASHHVVAHALVGADGFFGATAPLPSRRVRFTNLARYQARIGTRLSAALKLTRRLLVSSLESHSHAVTIRGRVIGPLAVPVATIVIERRLSCSAVIAVKRIKPAPNGTFKTTISAPANVGAAVYLAVTRVRYEAKRRKTFATKTSPRVVVIEP